MHLLNAAALLFNLPKRPIDEMPECPVEVIVRGQTMPKAVAWDLYRTAVTYLSGQLDEAETEADVASAMLDGAKLHELGIMTDEDVQRGVETVYKAILAAAERDGLTLTAG